MAGRLLACPACARHIRFTESKCPFCGAFCPGSFGKAPEPMRLWRGRSRAGQFRFHALAATGVIGGSVAFATLPSCGSSGDDNGATMISVLYGSPPLFSPCS